MGLVTSTTDKIATVPPPPPAPKTETTETTETSPPQDIVDISVNETTGSDPSKGLKTYGPPTLRDQFKFDIENGRFSTNGRYSALTPRFETVAQSTYESRAEVGAQIQNLAGIGSAQTALFTLGYQNASPDGTQVSSNVDARAEQNRRIDQNLDLLNML